MKIFVTDRSGNSQVLECDNKSTLMEVLRDNGMDIEAACGGCCACATCHVYVAKEWIEKLPPKEDSEEDMLDFAVHVKDNSRLSCQIKVTDDLDGIVLDMPENQY